MPLASRGCSACRAMKVKCDLTAPSCRRCLKAGRVCKGYRPEAELIFCDMNSVAEEKVKSRVKLTRQARGALDIHPGSSQSGDGASIKCQQLIPRRRNMLETISPSISTKWEDVAIPRFFVDYNGKSDVVEGNFNFIQEISSNSNSCPAFDQALRAVAYLSLANQCGLGKLRVEAKQSHCEALSLAARLLQNLPDAKKDSTLATIYLFGLYEMISGELTSGTAWDPYHHNGRRSVMKIRGEDQFRTATARNLFRVNYIHLTMKCLLLHQQQIEEAEKWLELIGHDAPQKLSRCNLQVASICAKAQKLFDAKTQDELWVLGLLEIIKEGVLLDIKYQEWSESHTGMWLPYNIRTSLEKVSANPLSSSVKPPEALQQHVYHDLFIAFNWNIYRSCRIHLLEVLVRLNTLIQSHPCAEDLSFDFKETTSNSKSTISELVSDICASVPYCLGAIDSDGNPATSYYRKPLGGYLVYWPMYIAMESSEKGGQTEAWLRDQFKYIADVMGIRVANTVVTRGRKDPWNLR